MNKKMIFNKFTLEFTPQECRDIFTGPAIPRDQPHDAMRLTMARLFQHGKPKNTISIGSRLHEVRKVRKPRRTYRVRDAVRA